MNLNEITKRAFNDSDILAEDIPQIDLYMDQILTLFDEKLSQNKRFENEKLITKTMINNYSKEKLLMPVKGKKYTKQHIMQMLCIYILKQTITLNDIKTLTNINDIDFEKAYIQYLSLKKDLKNELSTLLTEKLQVTSNSAEDILALSLALSSASEYMRRMCENIVDEK